MILIENVSYKYPKSDDAAVSDFSAQFRRGEITALSGKNGCGKTTLTKLLVGALRPDSGRVSIDDLDTAGMDLFEIGRRAGYLFQNPNRQLFCDTVYNEVAFGLRNLGMDEAGAEETSEYYLGLFDLTRYRDIYPGKLSLGEKQRLVLAAVLALGTDYLVLDEPTTGLDIRRRDELGELLLRLKLEKNCGVVVASHDAAFISKYADGELVMSK